MRHLNLISEQSEMTITALNKENIGVELKAIIIELETNENCVNIQVIKDDDPEVIVSIDVDTTGELAEIIKKIIRKLILKGFYTTKIGIVSSIDCKDSERYFISILSNWNDGIELIDESEVILDDIQMCDANSHLEIHANHINKSLDIEEIIVVDINSDKTRATIQLQDGYNFSIKVKEDDVYSIIRQINDSIQKYGLEAKYIEVTFSVFKYRFMLSKYDDNILIINVQ